MTSSRHFNRVVLYGTAACPYCVRAEQLLRARGVDDIEKIRVDLDPHQYDEMLARSGGRRTVPQIFIGGQHIGGCDDLVALDRAGQLSSLLAAAGDDDK